MPRPDRSLERRSELRPALAQAFAELGYRRATTAELARRCGTQETVLYRLWPDKKAMFLAAIEHVLEHSERVWEALLAGSTDRRRAAARLLEHEAEHHGERQLHRIVFAGLSETDDPDVRAALRRMYRGFHRFIKERWAEHVPAQRTAARVDGELVAWALIGLGTIASIGREVGAVDRGARRELFTVLGARLLDLGNRPQRPAPGRSRGTSRKESP